METIMKHKLLVATLALAFVPMGSVSGQEAPAAPSPTVPSNAPPDSGSSSPEQHPEFVDSPPPSRNSSTFPQAQPGAPSLSLRDKVHNYLGETFLNPAVLTAPAFRAGLRMANPPTHGGYSYPPDWRQGAEGFGRNYGDAFAERVTTHTARFLTGAITREDPRYFPSASHNFFARSFHAFAFTFVDRSDQGHPMPAISNLAGAAAGGAVGMAYLPPGFDTVSFAGRRAAIDFAALGGANLFREFAPQLPGPVRELFLLIGR
jgi:hypothetical protein